MKKLIVTADALNLRARPSIQGEIIDILANGDIVDWLDSSGDDYWRRIKSGENTGWASQKYLKPVRTETLKKSVQNQHPHFPGLILLLMN